MRSLMSYAISDLVLVVFGRRPVCRFRIRYADRTIMELGMRLADLTYGSLMSIALLLDTLTCLNTYRFAPPQAFF